MSIRILQKQKWVHSAQGLKRNTVRLTLGHFSISGRTKRARETCQAASADSTFQAVIILQYILAMLSIAWLYIGLCVSQSELSQVRALTDIAL